MDIAASIDLEALASACVGRASGTLFTLRDQQYAEFTGLCRGRAVLITGAAGFIAQATLDQVLAAEPRVLFLVDSSENGLAALARTLVTARPQGHPTDIRMVLADVTSPLFNRAVLEMGPLDLVLHFAAVKHVRSERDAASALRIFDVNVRGTHRILQAVSRMERPPHVFAVSTDKSVRPSSLMGASKAVMEELLWAYPGTSTSARFANVLFSSGSITESWVNRLAAGKPLSAPLDTLRYFVSPVEAGLICTHAIIAPDGSVTIPDSTSLQVTDLVQLAQRFLAYFGRTAVPISLADYDKDPMAADLSRFAPGEYPLVCTPRDTAGEKKAEEFVSPKESANYWTSDLALIRDPDRAVAEPLLTTITEWVENPETPVTVEALRTLVSSAVPGFHGSDTDATLDHRI